jgi:hypothetical protein
VACDTTDSAVAQTGAEDLLFANWSFFNLRRRRRHEQNRSGAEQCVGLSLHCKSAACDAASMSVGIARQCRRARWIGVADVWAGALIFVKDLVTAFAAAEAKLAKVLSSVPDHALGHTWLGVVGIFTRRAAEGIAQCEHALELDRNLAIAHAAIGMGKILDGRAEDTEAHIAEALRLSQRDTLAYVWITNAAPCLR